MGLDLNAFALGLYEELTKQASTDMQNIPHNENILPTSSSQLKWKYARTKDGLKLSDGNLAYHFHGFPDTFSHEDHRVTRGDDDHITNFEKDHVSKGTAQIHRSAPDNVFLTLADGRENPTFMLQHEGGKQWRYTPTKKFIAKLQASSPKVTQPKEQDKPAKADLVRTTLSSNLFDEAAFLKGASEYLL